MRKRFLILFSVFLMFVLTGCGTQQLNTATNGEKVTGQETVKEETDRDDTEKAAEEQVEEKSSESDDNEGVETENSRDGALSELKVHFIDVGQADATLLEFDSFTILIDAGDWNSNNVVNYLHAQDISELDIAIGTHPDADHIGQLDKVINQLEVGEVWLSGNTSTSKTYQRVIEAIDSSGVGYDEPRTGDVYDLGSLKVEVLFPNSISGNSNEESISLKLTYGEIDFIFTGDAETTQEKLMIQNRVDLGAEILQLGHHGSNTSTSHAFLDAVSPEVAIYSAGQDNQYGHPHEEVINRVDEYGTDIYGTDVHGTIIVTTDGVTYEIATKEDGTITPSGSSSAKQENNGTVEQPITEPQESIHGECVDINNASAEKLQEIIHIGPARSQDLIDLRPYASIDELTKINGIGPARIDDIKAEGKACIGG